jgi:hypothetical protein
VGYWIPGSGKDSMQRRRWLSFIYILGVLALAGMGCAGPGKKVDGAGSRFEKLAIFGDPAKNGIFDVSVEYGPDGTGWLAYSRVELPIYVSTHLARSRDQGKTWVHVAKINDSQNDTITVDGKAVTGAWRYETPTLVYDPEDDPARHWKLYVERYFTVPPHKQGNSLHGQGWIEVKYARQPDGAWSEAVRLFGSRASGSRIDLNQLHPDLREMKFYNEVGSIALDGMLYLTLDASPTDSRLGDWENRTLILIASRDHGETWAYAGTLTDYDDASGYHVLTGSSPVKEGERVFLLVTPSGAKGFGRKKRGHDGTWIIEFEDITRARLKRDAEGKLVVLRKIPVDLDTGGLSDYHEQNAYGGILFPQINVKARPDVFQTYMTRQRVLSQP